MGVLIQREPSRSCRSLGCGPLGRRLLSTGVGMQDRPEGRFDEAQSRSFSLDCADAMLRARQTESEEGYRSWLRDASHDPLDSCRPIADDRSKGRCRGQFDRTGGNADTHGKLPVDEFGERVNKGEADRIWTGDGYAEKETDAIELGKDVGKDSLRCVLSSLVQVPLYKVIRWRGRLTREVEIDDEVIGDSGANRDRDGVSGARENDSD